MRVRLRGLTVLMLLVLVGALVMFVPAAGASTPVAVWHMNEPAGAATMTDAVDGHNGSLQNVQTGVPGFQGSGYRFNGSNSVAVVPASGDFNPGNANFSFIVHVNFTTVPSAAVVDYDLLRGPTQGAYKMEIVARNNRTKAKALCFFQGSGGKATLVAGPHLADGRWHTLECRKTSSAIQLLVDGAVFTKAASVGSLTNTGPVSLGAKSYRGGGDWYQGLMDEVSISIN
jgi:concanavalin A-like lectin/glucanase superfamily protein